MSRIRLNRVALGMIAVLTIAVCAVFAPVISSHDPLETNGQKRLALPSPEHFMGTDQLGRDILSRVLYGGRSSLLIGFCVVSIVTLVSIPVGTFSGYYTGLDRILMRIIDGLMAFPSIIVAITFAAMWGTGKLNIIFALSFAYFPRMTRVVRSVVLSTKEMDYVDSARVAGATDRYILRRYILRNALSPVIVQATFIFALAILDEAALSFLGIGIQSPEPSWGGMINEGRNYMVVSPGLMLFPGVVMLLAVMGLNILGDGLRDALDPRIKER